MKNDMPSQQWKKWGKHGVGHEKWNGFHVPRWKTMLYKVTSRYITIFLAYHYDLNSTLALTLSVKWIYFFAFGIH